MNLVLRQESRQPPTADQILHLQQKPPTRLIHDRQAQIIGSQRSISTPSLTIITTRLYPPRTSYASPNGDPHVQSHFTARSRCGPPGVDADSSPTSLHVAGHLWPRHSTNPSCALPDIAMSWVTNHFLAAADCGVHFFVSRCLLFVLFCLFLRSRFVNRPALVSRLPSTTSQSQALFTYLPSCRIWKDKYGGPQKS